MVRSASPARDVADIGEVCESALGVIAAGIRIAHERGRTKGDTDFIGKEIRELRLLGTSGDMAQHGVASDSSRSDPASHRQCGGRAQGRVGEPALSETGRPEGLPTKARPLIVEARKGIRT